MPASSPDRPAPLNHRYRLEAGGCPIEAALDVIAGRWKGLILFRVGLRAQRFHELRKTLPHVSQRMLVRQLRELERSGLIARSVSLGVPAKVEYSSTDAGRTLLPLLIELRNWSARHLLGIPEVDFNAQLRASQNAFPLRGSRRPRASR